ncbi:MAG: Rossmann fold nucleotide-binding protein [Actinomycetota bacterium]
MRSFDLRPPQICVLGSAEPGSSAYERAGDAGAYLADIGFTVVSGCGSAATRYAAERAMAQGGQVVSIIPSDDINMADWPCTVLIPCGMGDARNLMMALAGDACLVIGGRAGTKSEVCLAWLHHRPLLPLTGTGGWSDTLAADPPDERENAPILEWATVDALARNLWELGFPVPAEAPPA